MQHRSSRPPVLTAKDIGSAPRAPQRLCVASPELVERVRSYVDAYGVLPASKMLDSSREVVTRVLSGLGVRRGSIAMIQGALARRDALARAAHQDGAT